MTDTLTIQATPTLNGTHELLQKSDVLQAFWFCQMSREASVIARKEVLTGKAKFGIVGDGKELPQIVMAKYFQKGDWRSGYYRDQTFMFAKGLCSVEEFFAQLYADPENDPFSGGRQMNNHFATKTVDKITGEWTNHKALYNVASDTSNTAGQMPRALGIALASKKYREHKTLSSSTPFSDKGNEVSFVTIGDASTSEGPFWESLNAAGVMQVPMVTFVWDDGYGISVPTKFQTTKGSISAVLQGFNSDENGAGVDIYTAKGWDYVGMCEVFEKAIEKTRRTHTPCLIHVTEVTQPQGHSTSGSHERYKDAERLNFEKTHDCIVKLKEYILENAFATSEELDKIEADAKIHAREGRKKAWTAFHGQAQKYLYEVVGIYDTLSQNTEIQYFINEQRKNLKDLLDPHLSEITKNVRITLFQIGNKAIAQPLKDWYQHILAKADDWYHSELHSDSPKAALKVAQVAPIFTANSASKNGYEIINTFFDKAFEKYPETYAFGEDVGKIGDVNQGFVGLQTKYGEDRIFDVGIRELTIMGQALGMSIRGMKPIAEIQYLDYIYYGLELLADDITCIRYRSKGLQQAPAIIRTRGHRLEGIWHSGSPLGMMVHSLRGMYVCVPRNFTQAAGMYNTLLQSDDPAIVVEPLNGYRLKEQIAENIGEYTISLGKVDILQEGTDITLVTYGSCVRIAQEAIALLAHYGISVELIDAQTLLPFDLGGEIGKSLQKTNKIIFLDEDVPGGATSYMMQEVLEKQGGYRHLDAAPLTITAAAHRPPYGSDGDYFSKPSAEDIFEHVYKMMMEIEPNRFPNVF
jgi:pyruvate/2-oxoglutarate/acetoin dehydrogenase E1 component/TPP-dependent pyruvate/acetoin dehydrogenase alpha subunit